MQIAVISSPTVAVPPASYGGTELVIAVLVRELVAAGHHVILYATGDSDMPGAELRYCFASAVWPPSPSSELTQAQFAMHEIAARHDVDVVHAHIPSALPFATMLDCPVIYTIHHERQATLLELYVRVRSRTLRIVAISRRQAELCPELDTDVVHHGLDPADYAVGGGGEHVVFIGRLDRIKGPHIAIDAARAAGLSIRAAGKSHGDEPFFTRELLPRLALDGVEYVGEVSHQPKVRLLGGALATLVPIDWEEPFGLVLVESMLCGTPVVAFGRGAVPELVEEGVTGYIVSDRRSMIERLQALRRNPRILDRARCREHAVRRFGAARMASAYLAVYERARTGAADRTRTAPLPQLSPLSCH